MTNPPQSSYLQYLPALFYDQPFVGAFLLAFESILAGLPTPPEAAQSRPDDLPEGYDQVLDRIHTFYVPQAPQDETSNSPLPSEPQQAPAEFLPWLAQWVGLSLRDDWDEATKRRFISQIVPLYRYRGTKIGLQKLLKLYTQEEVAIYEPAAPPYYFQVDMVLSEAEPSKLRQKERIAHALIQHEKPAHTFYALRISIPTMRLLNDPPAGKTGLVLGRNTVLGTRTSSSSD